MIILELIKILADWEMIIFPTCKIATIWVIYGDLVMCLCVTSAGIVAARFFFFLCLHVWTPNYFENSGNS